ncbi:Gfo/Idh/MocA family oxidoreductase [Dyadobacter sp. 676]|uniref:Gfo/Idh/MocA family oxidoreductase n=1 Tax=Dyadobacter sp. 676 TaxID=3088362 RepID=A0AAU8FJA2_9BACT
MNIGIIGMSAGNAHPYSWSAIINGVFDGEEIARVGYPAVTAYLEANRDTLGIRGARVTHVWAQEAEIAESIAKSAGIENVSESLAEMAGEVDAVILARDDPENHREMARPFLEAGVPVFIDKPLAYSREDLAWFAEQHRAGKFLMSCSSMRYANECRIARQEIRSFGRLELVTAVGKKDWKKYGVHLLEGVFAILGDPIPHSVRHIGGPDREIIQLRIQDGPDIMLHLFMNITGTFQISLFGENSWKLIDIRNSYSMFRDTIIEFVRSLEEGRPRLDFEKTERIMQVIIGAKESLERDGQEVFVGL